MDAYDLDDGDVAQGASESHVDDDAAEPVADRATLGSTEMAADAATWLYDCLTNSATRDNVTIRLESSITGRTGSQVFVCEVADWSLVVSALGYVWVSGYKGASSYAYSSYGIQVVNGGGDVVAAGEAPEALFTAVADVWSQRTQPQRAAFAAVMAAHPTAMRRADRGQESGGIE